jgi:hypothetical protein
MKRFVITLVPLPGIDGIRALRAVLKTALRRHGLRATDVRGETEPASTYTKVFTELRRDVAARRAARTSPYHDDMSK